MSIFLSEHEKRLIGERRDDATLCRFLTALARKADRRAASPGLLGLGEDADWWYPAAEYVSEAAMAYAIQPTEMVGAWLRDVTLSIIRRPVSDWVGPWFRDHSHDPAIGHLETAHLCWAVSTALDLAEDVFETDEREEIEEGLGEKGSKLCRRWLDANRHLANWRAVMNAGAAVTAAVVQDNEAMEYAAEQFATCTDAFQPDGSYAESLQYGNYLAFALMMTYEALTRADPAMSERLDFKPYASSVLWMVYSYFYTKPLSGWGSQPRPRFANFNDCGAVFQPSGDLLLHIAARGQKSMPTEAGLARWLFDVCYADAPTRGPHNLATFGLRNNWGFLTVPFLAQSPEAVTPEEADLPLLKRFSNGNAFARDTWGGKTILAISGAADPLHGPGHLHGDLNSFILAHNRERLLVDPGHSCYRNIIHGLEASSQTHNTCTFLVASDELGLQEDLAKSGFLEQRSLIERRKIGQGRPGPPVDRGGRMLLVSRLQEVSVIGSEAGSLYGEPIVEFSRFWLMAGANVLFIVDRIQASRPVKTVWNWLLNNRDANSDVELSRPNQLVMRRGCAGLKLFHTGDASLNGPVYAFVHDAYHTEPAKEGEGRPGSGLLYRWIEKHPSALRTQIHALAVDDYGLVNQWKLEKDGERNCTLARGDARWTIEIASERPLELRLSNDADGRRWTLIEQENQRFKLLWHD